MKISSFLSLVVITGAGLNFASARAEAPLRGVSGPVTMFVKGTPGKGPSDITSSTDLSTPLWATRSGLPALAPDQSHQLTLGEWLQGDVRGFAKCAQDGTHVVMHFSGLIPNGVYTVWTVIFDGPFPAASATKPFPFGNLVGVGALGANDGSENSFQASASGEAELTAFMPTGLISDFGPPFLNSRYDLQGCLLDETEFHFVAVYHFDNQTYGPGPGFEHGGAEQVGLMFHP